MHASGPEVYRVVFHEYVHLVLRHAAGNVPVWFNEGTAELYSTADLSGPEIRIGDLIPSHIVTLRTEKMLDISMLVAVDHESSHYNERGKSGIFYAQSWALAHMLNFSPEYQPGVMNFLEMILAGESHQAAFERAFGKTQGDVLRDLARYIRQDRFVGMRVRSRRVEIKANAGRNRSACRRQFAARRSARLDREGRSSRAHLRAARCRSPGDARSAGRARRCGRSSESGQ